MKFEKPVYEGIIEKRYKRFLSDITLKSGEFVHAHVPNTGSMTNCWAQGWKVLVTYHDDPKRKMQYTLEATHNGKTWIGVNTSRTNKIVKEALELELIKELKGYKSIKPEAKVLESRIDFYLSEHKSKENCYVEVKNVTLNDGDKALFPDAVSTRGQKHLKDLIQLKAEGFRACMLYLINRSDVISFSPATDVDPEYARLLKEAKSAGVEILAYQTKISKKEIILTDKIKVKI
tara:strand:+ start:261406 stop:262104 length:699 start_codon:yes stop_codon:yes gene_type:complete